jgi:hypothetical protein
VLTITKPVEGSSNTSPDDNLLVYFDVAFGGAALFTLQIYLGGNKIHERNGTWLTGSYTEYATIPGFDLQPETQYTIYIRGWDGIDTWYASAPVTFTTSATTVKPTKASNPSPTNAASNQRLNTSQLSWSDGGGADSYDVYFGPTGNMSLRSSSQAAETFSLADISLSYNTTYQWRIDSINGAGTTTGDTWSFSTLAFDPVLPTGVTLDGDGNPTGDPTGENNIITVQRLIVVANDKVWYEDI